MLRFSYQHSFHDDCSDDPSVFPKVNNIKRSYHQSVHKNTNSSINQYLNLINKSPSLKNSHIDLKDLKNKYEAVQKIDTKFMNRRKGAIDKQASQFRKDFAKSKCPQIISNIFSDIALLEEAGYSNRRIVNILEACTEIYQIHHIFLKQSNNIKQAWIKSKILRDEKKILQLCLFYFSNNQHKFNNFILDLRLFQQKLSQQMVTLKNKQNSRLAELILNQPYIKNQDYKQANTQVKNETQLIVTDLTSYIQNNKKMMEEQFDEATKWLQTYIISNEKVFKIEK